MARGQSEVLGMVLLLGMTVAGASVVVVTASSAMDGAQQTSAVQRAEHSMSLLDARGALVALGRTGGQSVSLADSAGGSYRVRSDTGRIVVSQRKNNDTMEYVNTTLGAVVYENGDTTVAYQGGGVWKSQGAGASMISPPEFNYRGATLTFPVIRVTGGQSAAIGGATAHLSPNEVARSVFPTQNRSNPLQGGNVTVSVYSDYYRGWASFFEDRTAGNVTVHPEQSKVELQLIARDSGGAFTLQETPIDVRGLAEDDPIQSLSFTLEAKNPSGFPNGWNLVANNGGGTEFRVKGGSGNPCKEDEISVNMTYSDGVTTQSWENESAFSATGSTFGFDCAEEVPTLDLHLTGKTNLTYVGEGSPLSNNSTGNVVNHYLPEIGSDVTLEFEKGTGGGNGNGNGKGNGNSAGVRLDGSTGEMEYNASSSRVVTFLHITRNSMNVTVA